MASTSVCSRSRNVVALPRRCLFFLLLAALTLFSSSSLVGTGSTIFVQAASYENETTVTLKNTKIVAPGVQQEQGKIAYDAGYVDLTDLVFTVTPHSAAAAANAADGSDSNSNGALEFFYMDLAILEVPEICHDGANNNDTTSTTSTQQQGDGNGDNMMRHCDWAEAWTLGISIPTGEKNSLGEPEIFWCCTKTAMEQGACTQENYGRLLVNETLFKGQLAFLQIPASGKDMNGQDYKSSLPMEAMSFGLTKAGMYTLIMASCNEDATLDVIVNGDMIWASFDQVEEAQEAIPFYIILGIGYAILSMWFWYLLQANKSSRIKLEEWIFGTMALGFFEMLFRAIEFFFWSSNSSRLPLLSLIATIASAAKHSFGRCLLLMVAMGWGVVRASLARHTFLSIVAMGTFYLSATALFDIYYTIEWADDIKSNDNSSGVEGNGASEVEETPMSDFVQICFWLSFYIDIVFMIWIPSAMCQTMHYLKTTNQLRKLERYQVLLKIMIGAVVLTIVTIILVFTRAFGLSFLDINEGNEINFFIILTFVAVVWRPNPNARDFAYAMELGTGDDDNDNGTTDLELVAESACDFQQQQQSRRSNNGTYEGGGAPTIDRAEPHDDDDSLDIFD